MYNDISELIREVSVYSNPDKAYFNSFVSRFKMYREAKTFQRRVLAFYTTLTIITIIGYFWLTL